MDKQSNQVYHGFKQVMIADGPTNFWAHICRGRGGESPHLSQICPIVFGAFLGRAGIGGEGVGRL
jgi:hypothetical protein